MFNLCGGQCTITQEVFCITLTSTERELTFAVADSNIKPSVVLFHFVSPVLGENHFSPSCKTLYSTKN
ncbi:hypothetical protein UES1_246 [Escherichia phage UE-S1]|nr:hypothetical protein UES1_246 [Escherichia phage UE-S1]